MTSQSYSYSIFSYVTDDVRGTSIPVGIALWGSDPEQVRLRVVRDDEHVKGLKAGALPQIRLVQSQILHWIKRRDLPYASRAMSPNSEQWWRHLMNVLEHRIRVSDPHAVATYNAEEDIDLLFEALVKPERDEKQKSENIDRALSKSLGPLARALKKSEVPGYKGRPITVKRSAEDDTKVFVVEGINLASGSAEFDSDALVSRLQRIRAANGQLKGKQVVAIVGYLASPHGLNGEGVLVDWIRQKGEAQTFDLTREQSDFVAATEVQLQTLATHRARKRMFQ